MAYERSKLIEAIFSFIRIVQKYYPTEKVDVRALFHGGADSQSDDTGIVPRYKGEFGTIIKDGHHKPRANLCYFVSYSFEPTALLMPFSRF